MQPPSLISRRIFDYMFKSITAVAALFLAGLASAQANEEAVKFKNYAFGMPGAELKRQYRFTCTRKSAAPADESRDPELRMLEMQNAQASLYRSGETICTPRNAETVVGFPVDAQFGLFSDRLEQITLRFSRDSDSDQNAEKQIQVLIDGLDKRHGYHALDKHTICTWRSARGNYCKRDENAITYTWHGRDGRIDLIVLERQSIPMTLTYTSKRFESERAKYEAESKVLQKKADDRRGKLKAEEDARRAKDF